MFNVFVIGLLYYFFVVIYSEPNTTETIAYTVGCIDSSTSAISGNYSRYKICNDHSIWVKNATIGEDSYIIYWNNLLTESYYEYFGFFRCNSLQTYISQSDMMDCISPSELMGCSGAPLIYCPCLSDDDVGAMMDGMGMADSNIDWVEKANFYECNHWFVYDESTNSDSSATLTFESDELCYSHGNDKETRPPIVGGEETRSGATENETSTISTTNLIIIWSIVSVFLVLSIIAIVWFAYQARQKKLQNASLSINVGLTQEKEENKFSAHKNQSSLIIDDDAQDDQVAV